MCLAIPGKVAGIDVGSTPLMGDVDFGGIQKKICLDWLSGVKVGEYVIVHVGFAIDRMDEREAGRVFEYLQSVGEVNNLEQEENYQ